MSDIFDWSANGLIWQRGYAEVPEYQVVEDERELGNVSSTVVAERETRLIRGLQLLAPTREARDYVMGFFRRVHGPAARFLLDYPECVAGPDAAPTVAATAGGSQAQRTITIRHAWRTVYGTTRASATATITVPANELLVVTIEPYPPSCPQCVIYAAQGDPGNEQEQVALSGARTWTQPDAALLLATASPPTTNTARERLLCKLVAGSLEATRLHGLTWMIQMTLEEVHS